MCDTIYKTDTVKVGGGEQNINVDISRKIIDFFENILSCRIL